MMTGEKIKELSSARAEAYRATLMAIRAVCENAVFGAWRHQIAGIIDRTLRRYP